jgi:hypothetical protein
MPSRWWAQEIERLPARGPGGAALPLVHRRVGWSPDHPLGVPQERISCAIPTASHPRRAKCAVRCRACSQALTEAHPLVEQHEERCWEAEVCRLRGVLLLRQPRPPQAEAEAWLQQALDVARRQEAKSLELRAAMSLSQLWQQQGKQAEAHELLAPIYGWFTEGFDTADLQEAKVLLEELGG